MSENSEDRKLIPKGMVKKLFNEQGHKFITTFTEKGKLKDCAISLTKIAYAIDQLPAESKIKIHCDAKDCIYNKTHECVDRSEIDVGSSGCWCYNSIKK